MSLVKPNILAEALGITTGALRKRRYRGTKSPRIDYIVTDKGRVMYDTELLDPSVRSNVEKVTTKRTNLSHEERMKKDFRYANSLGKINERKKRIHQAEVDARAKQLVEREKIAQMKLQEQRSGVGGPRSQKQYASWVDPFVSRNYWNSIQDYERSKQKKKIVPFY